MLNRILPIAILAPFASAQVATDELSLESLRDLQIGTPVVTTLIADDLSATPMQLERFDPFTANAPIVVAGARGSSEVERPDVVLLRGTLLDDPDSLVFLGVSDAGTHGFIESDGSTRSVSTGPHAQALALPSIIDVSALPAPEPFCATTEIGHNPTNQAFPVSTGMAPRGAPCRVIKVAVETDFEFSDVLFGGDTSAAAAYATTLMAGVGEIYRRDFNVRLAISYLRTWEDNSDPYTVPEAGQFLNDIRATFLSMPEVERDLGHGLSARPLGGGVAWLSTVCNVQWGYGISGNLGGHFPIPMQNHQPNNWDPYVVAHEIGHNCGTLHTHDGYTPVIDDCGNGDCSSAFGGTIMSYCHTCPGGTNNIQLAFHERVITQVHSYLDTLVCDLDGETDINNDTASTYVDLPVTVDVLINDVVPVCTLATIDTHDSTSTLGGTVTLAPGAGMNGVDALTYTPPAGLDGFDSFSYTADGQSATVLITIDPLRAPDSIALTKPGINATYYEVIGASSLPDFDALTPYAEADVNQINFPSTGGAIAGSGRADEVGIVFDGLITVPQSGVYTLYTTSDDGSRVIIDGQPVVINDGLHGMIENSGTIGLEAGAHELTVEYFENFGGAGVIVSIEGPGLSKQPIPASMWSRHPACSADLAEPFGNLDTFDLLGYLFLFDEMSPLADISAPFASWDFFDLLAFLSLFDAGCP